MNSHEEHAGPEVWRALLPGKDARFASMLVEGGTSFAASRAHAFAHDPDEGASSGRDRSRASATITSS
ncbi:MAG: hypothetical protein VXZ39_02605 [Planctomycetota bacterium]|nr:hypothetical protein [Planctomycetota bacterium]MEC8493784.1 hypothetical protein [Planctomycetota bacterium]